MGAPVWRRPPRGATGAGGGYDAPPTMKIISLILLAGLYGCAIGRTAENEPLEQEKIAQLKPGTMTAGDVVGIMGAPVDVVQLGRRSAYLYIHRMERTTGIVLIVLNFLNQDERQDRVWVFFDEDGKLTHVGSTLEAARAQVAAPWEDIYKDQQPPQNKTAKQAADNKAASEAKKKPAEGAAE